MSAGSIPFTSAIIKETARSQLRHACGPSSRLFVCYPLDVHSAPLGPRLAGLFVSSLTPVQPSLVSGQGKRSRRCPRSHAYSQRAPRLLAISRAALIRPNYDGRHCVAPVFPLEASVQRNTSWASWTYTRSSFAAVAAGSSKMRDSSRPEMPTKPRTR